MILVTAILLLLSAGFIWTILIGGCRSMDDWE